MFQAVCRVCKKPVLRQNYKDHLKDVHKGEDPLDRRQWGDADNRGLFRGLTSSGDKNHNVRRKDGEGNIYRPEAGTDTTGTKRILLENDVVGEDLSDVVGDLSENNRAESKSGDDVNKGREGGRSRSRGSSSSGSRESSSSGSRKQGRSGCP